MTTKARIVRFAAPGGPEVLKLETIDLPDPGPGEVQVRQSAVGLNFQEIYQRSGFYPMPLPAGLSGCVKTPTMSWPAACKAANALRANSGVPAKTIFIGRLALAY